MTKTRSRRWLRLAVPPAVVLLLILTGLVVYQWEQPDEEDAAYLSPVSTADIGAQTLAGRVAAAGTTLQRVEKTSDGVVAANRGNTTLLLTTPQLVNADYLRMLLLLPRTTRVVLVEPNLATLTNGQLPIHATRRALASEPSLPGCDYAPAAAAGTAGVRRTRYGPVDRSAGQNARCFDDSLVAFNNGGATVTVVGSADPFRNDRIDERGNAKLTLALLTTTPRLVWVDLHHLEPPPGIDNNPNQTYSSVAPSYGPAPTDDPARPTPGTGQGGDPQPNDPPLPQPPPDAERSNPLWHAFPAWTYVAVALLLMTMVLLALAMGARMGGPVAEPLPVVVRAIETVSGRGRLYQRAKARERSLTTLRAAALTRISRLLRLEAEAERDTLVAAVAARTGWPAQNVEQTLFAAAPEDDQGLVDAAVQLERLVNAVATEPDAAEGAPR